MSADLERELRALAAAEPFPPTPDVAAAVRTSLASAPARTPRRFDAWAVLHGMRPAVAAALAVVIVLGSLAAVEPVRSAVLDVLGLRGARIERRAPAIAPGGVGQALDLGRRTTLSRATARAGFGVVAPTVPGAPSEVWFDVLRTGGPQVAFVWDRPGPRPGDGLLLTQVRAGVEQIIAKAAGSATRIERVTVDGEPGFWLAGEPHQFAYVTPSGNADVDTIRLAGPTLLWEHDGLLLRLEGAPSKAVALAIARSVKPA